MTQTQLARSAELGLSTVVDFERGRRPVSQEAIDALRKALGRVGVDFIDENGRGEGVRLRKPSTPKKRK
jgi:transcriptional regulator with XRE-family HTH domain